MKNCRIYYYIFLSVLVLLLGACRDSQKKLNRRVSLWRKDKIPYGTYYAFENLKYVFPEARVTINKTSPADFQFHRTLRNHDNSGENRSIYVVIAPVVVPDSKEITGIMNYVGNGNQVLISAFYFGDSLLNQLGARLHNPMGIYFDRDSMQLSIYNPYSYDSLSFSYPGLADDNALSKMDTQYTTVLGRDALGRPDFVKFGYRGGGAIYLHFAPTAFTNFFLLHKNNKAYYDNVFSYMPSEVKEIKWDEYFRYPRGNNFSTLRFMLSNRSLRWALWLTALLFLIVYLFESKRRQRIIKAIAPMRNSSLDFIKTVGRLYLQRKDNGNLALKLNTHFLEYVRNKYNIATSQLDEDFVDRLSFKSGMKKEEIRNLVELINAHRSDRPMKDEALMDLNRKIEDFYKQA